MAIAPFAEHRGLEELSILVDNAKRMDNSVV